MLRLVFKFIAVYSRLQAVAAWVGWLLRTALRVFIPRDLIVPRHTPALLPVLPSEIIDIIIGNYLELAILQSQRSIRDFRIRRKEYLLDIGRLKLCSRDFCTRVDDRMSRIWPHWTARGPCSIASEHGTTTTIQYGRETRIVIADVCSWCLPQGANLALYSNLESISLNCHNALKYDQLSNMFSIIPIERVVALPHFLTQLEVLHSHRPVDQIINLATSTCPGLVELRIVRCTMFNKPDCWWWRQHWHDADHDYMRNHVWQNMEEYADTLAGSLYGLKNLQSFHIGHYMTHIDAVTTHRSQHKKHHPKGFRDSFSPVDRLLFHNGLHLQAMQIQDGGPPIDPNSVALAKRELWEAPCPQCEYELKVPIENTERWVAVRLASKLESIRTISFPSFLSERRICPSHWAIQREIKSGPGKRWGTVDKLQAGYKYPPGAKLRVRTKASGSGYFNNSYEIIFDNAHGEWRPARQ